MVEGLENINTDTASSYALEIVQKWITTTYCGFNRTGEMFEKYNAEVIGQPGQGGEYVVQAGFGWTNGVTIMFLNLYGDQLVAPDSCN
jgi:alpha,alpha-trehalase